MNQFEKDLRRYAVQGIPRRERLFFGMPSTPLQGAGISPYPMLMSGSVLEKILTKHSLSLEQLISVQQELHSPIMVFASDSIPGAKLLITSLVRTEKPIVVAIHQSKLGHKNLVACLVSSIFGACLRSKDRIWRRQFRPQSHFQPPTPLPQQSTPNRVIKEQRAKFSAHPHVERKGGCQHVFLSAKQRFGTLCCKQLGQLLPSKCRVDGLVNRLRGQILSLQDRCDVWAWLQNKVLERSLRSHGKILFRWLRRLEWLDRAILFATVLTLCKDRRHNTSETNNNHNLLDSSKFYLRIFQCWRSTSPAVGTSESTCCHQSVNGKSLHLGALQQGRGGGNPPLPVRLLRANKSLRHQSENGKNSHSGASQNQGFRPGFTVVPLGQNLGRIALFQGEKYGRFFRFASKTSPRVRHALSLTHFRSQNFSRSK